MAEYIFSNTSGYNFALDRLKTQIKSITDDVATQIFTDDNIFDYTSNITTAISEANMPFCIFEIDDELMKSDSNQNSDLVINFYIVFNNKDENFNIIFNQIISTIRTEFSDTFFGTFRIDNIERDSVPTDLNQKLNKYKPFYSAKFTTTYNSVKY